MFSDLQPGALFGRDFRVVRPLRAGGMGAVYIVEQLSTGKQRALKVMAQELAMDAATRERFVLEAKVGAHIDSDHVVEVVTAGVDEQTGAPFLVMELLKGEELADVIERIGAIPLGDVGEVVDQLGHALERAHARGIVHRDLKPENVFLAVSRRRDTNFIAKILDFGVAKIVADQQQKATQPLGTPLFMSPEQTEHSGRIAPASDVWALGLIVFKLLTGRDFWRGADGALPVILREICVDAIPAASARAAEMNVQQRLPAGFDEWFARCVTRDLNQRFPEAGAATRAFAELVPAGAERGVLARAVSPAPGSTQQDIGVARTVTASEAFTSPIAAASAFTAPSNVASSTVAATTSASKPEIVAAAPSKLPLVAGAGVAVLAVAAGAVFFMTRGSGKDDAPAPVPSAVVVAPSASAVAPPLEPSCPEGMILIQGGNMFMGTRSGEGNASPAHRVAVRTFCLDKTEVTTAAYVACASAGNCLRPLQDVDFPGAKPAQRDKLKKLCNVAIPGNDQHPINCVDWNMADNFCKAPGGRTKEGGARLPTEAEWEFAARGSKQRVYPWGDEEPTHERLNGCGTECKKWAVENREYTELMYPGDDGYEATAPVGSYPKGAAESGVLDLAGNVWEWTGDWYGVYTDAAQDNPTGADTGTERVVRGGAFNGWVADWAKPSYRWKTLPSTHNHAIGFRCAFSPAIH